MKRINNIIICTAASLLLLTSCEQDDHTGYSVLKPTKPVITVTVPDAADLDDAEQYQFTVNVIMSVEQIVDVAVHFVQLNSNAELSEDYSLSWTDPETGEPKTGSRLIIPKGYKSVDVHLEILTAELNDGSKNLTLQVGDTRTANATIVPVTFTIDRTPQVK